jgi:hypothetical protein
MQEIVREPDQLAAALGNQRMERLDRIEETFHVASVISGASEDL